MSEQVSINYPSLEGAENPYQQYDWLRSESPVYRVPGTDDFLVTRYDDVAAAAKDWRTFSSAGSRSTHNPFNETGEGNETHSMIEADPPSHRAKRDLCSHAFKPGQLRESSPMISAICDRVLADTAGAARIDFVTDVAERIPPLVLTKLMGFDEADLGWLSGWSRVDNGGLSFLPPEVQEQQRLSAKRATERLVGVILERHNHPRADELSEMIRRYADRFGGFDLDYLRDNAVTLIRGGVITTAHLISTTMLHLLQRPNLMRRVRDDRLALVPVIEESLRIESPVQWGPRLVTKDTEIGGVQIPKGARVLLFWGSANRDDTTFARADDFVDDRPNLGDHVAFGLGPHFCLGAPLARLETRIAFERVLDAWSDIRLAPGQSLDHAASAQFRGLNHLLIDVQR